MAGYELSGGVDGHTATVARIPLWSRLRKQKTVDKQSSMRVDSLLIFEAHISGNAKYLIWLRLG